MQGFPHAIQEFAKKFVALQNAPRQADYSCEADYDMQDTLATIVRAAGAVGQLEGASIHHRRGFVVHLLFKRRVPQEN